MMGKIVNTIILFSFLYANEFTILNWYTGRKSPVNWEEEKNNIGSLGLTAVMGIGNEYGKRFGDDSLLHKVCKPTGVKLFLNLDPTVRGASGGGYAHADMILGFHLIRVNDPAYCDDTLQSFHYLLKDTCSNRYYEVVHDWDRMLTNREIYCPDPETIPVTVRSRLKRIADSMTMHKNVIDHIRIKDHEAFYGYLVAHEDPEAYCVKCNEAIESLAVWIRKHDNNPEHKIYVYGSPFWYQKENTWYIKDEFFKICKHVDVLGFPTVGFFAKISPFNVDSVQKLLQICASRCDTLRWRLRKNNREELEIIPKIDIARRKGEGKRAPRRRPTQFETRALVNICLSRGVDGVMWYTYGSAPGDGKGLVDDNRVPYSKAHNNPDSLGWIGGNDPDTCYPYDWVKEINSELKKIGPVIKKIDFDTARSVAYPPRFIEPFRYIWNVYPINSPYATTYYEVSTFKGKGGKDYFMVVNRHTLRGDKITYRITIFMGAGGKIWRILSKDDSIKVWSGKKEPFAQFEYTFKPGEGVLFKVERNPSAKIFTLNPNATAYNNARKIAVGKNGITHICYMDSLENSPSVWYAASLDGGETWWETKIAPLGWYPVLRLNHREEPVVVWYWDKKFYYKNLVTGVSGIITEMPALPSKPPRFSFDFSSIGIVDDKDPRIIYEYGAWLVWEYNSIIYLIEFWERGAPKKYPPPLDPTPYCSSPSIAIDKYNRRIIAYEKNGKIILKCRGIYDNDWETKVLGTGREPSIDTRGSQVCITWETEEGLKVQRAEISNRGIALKDIETIPSTSQFDKQPEMVETRLVIWHNVKDKEIHYSVYNGEWGNPKPLSGPDNIRSVYAHGCYLPYQNNAYIIWTEGDSPPYEIKFVDPPSSDQDVMVIRPNGGESFCAGDYELIIWRVNGSHSIQSLLYYCDDYGEEGGPTWKPIATVSSPSKGVYEYNWKVPPVKTGGSYWALGSSHCRVKVVTFFGKGNSMWQSNDISDNNFTISNICTKIDEGKQMYGIAPPGSQKKIDWQCYGKEVEGVNLYLSRDGGESFNTIETQLPPGDIVATDTFVIDSDTTIMNRYEGSYQWTVPNSPSSKCRLKVEVYDNIGNTADDISRQCFIIPLPGGYEYSTFSNQQSISESENRIAIAYTGESHQGEKTIFYGESEGGYAFDSPNSLGPGVQPSTDEGVVCWLSQDRKKIYCSYQTETGFVSPTLIDYSLPKETKF